MLRPYKKQSKGKFNQATTAICKLHLNYDSSGENQSLRIPDLDVSDNNSNNFEDNEQIIENEYENNNDNDKLLGNTSFNKSNNLRYINKNINLNNKKEFNYDGKLILKEDSESDLNKDCQYKYNANDVSFNLNNSVK